MKAFLQQEMGLSDVRLLCPLADAPRWLLEQVEVASVEDVIRQECCKARRVIADPIYARLLPDEKENSFPCPMKPIPAVITTMTCQSSSGRPLRHG